MNYYIVKPYFGANLIQKWFVRADSEEKALKDHASGEFASEEIMPDVDGPYEELSDVEEITEGEYEEAVSKLSPEVKRFDIAIVSDKHITSEEDAALNSSYKTATDMYGHFIAAEPALEDEWFEDLPNVEAVIRQCRTPWVCIAQGGQTLDSLPTFER